MLDPDPSACGASCKTSSCFRYWEDRSLKGLIREQWKSWVADKIPFVFGQDLQDYQDFVHRMGDYQNLKSCKSC